MKRSKYHMTRRLLLALATIGSLLLAWFPPLAYAALPPRPPVPGPSPSDEDRQEEPIGATIELQSSWRGADGWAVVQWQDNAGGWHDVEGWRGHLDAGGGQRWWVAAKDFGAGSFRWVVSQEPGSEQLTASDPFILPDAANQTLQIAASLPPP